MTNAEKEPFRHAIWPHFGREADLRRIEAIWVGYSALFRHNRQKVPKTGQLHELTGRFSVGGAGLCRKGAGYGPVTRVNWLLFRRGLGMRSEMTGQNRKKCLVYGRAFVKRRGSRLLVL